jgi:hypothetical protein
MGRGAVHAVQTTKANVATISGAIAVAMWAVGLDPMAAMLAGAAVVEA